MRLRFRRALAALAVLSLSACVTQPPTKVVQHGLSLSPVGFEALPGWAQDHHAQAMPALLSGCAALLSAPFDQKLGGQGQAEALGGSAGQWRAVCLAARAVPPGDDAAARAFFEANFQPYAVADAAGSPADRVKGLYTGYYEPEVAGSRTSGRGYNTPLLGRPVDLVQVDLGDFFDDLKGRRLVGRVADGRLQPYWDRGAIETGALAGKRLELLWLADPIDAFFLQIQGSGRVRLPDGKVVRVTYAAQNGRPYVPIGRVLADKGQIPLDQVSMQSIRAWLAAHPQDAQSVMDQNPSYVFFRELNELRPNDGPPGALGVPLTPGRSIAVDRQYIPLGAPVWISTTDPLDSSPLQRLMLAQDVGGAIRGPARADLFFGWGQDAEERGGRMHAPGTEYVLLPRAAQTASLP
jgi:membrane-bound lytic murein transglycosylase A